MRRMAMRLNILVFVEEGRVDSDDIVAFWVHRRVYCYEGYGDEHHHDDVMRVEDCVGDSYCIGYHTVSVFYQLVEVGCHFKRYGA